MTPLLRESLATPLGKLLVFSTADGRLAVVDWLDTLDRLPEARRAALAAAPPAAVASAAVAALRRYFDGDLQALDALDVDPQGSPLQQQVWTALRTIPPGRTCSYAELAERIGRAGSARAIGAAVGANPLLLVLPCHRVVGANGALTGYAAGLERKRWLLEHEGLLPRLAHGASGRATRLPR
ncbi:methylated-DNA--[protein]-cysteine S-methyltransferase [Aquimonas voraii]|nr:methylated-DNA--[protein]-cysteine S-methyltransferase [Aquimonas voraii]